MWRIRYILFIVLMSSQIFCTYAQKEDYTWVLGYDGGSTSPIDTGALKNFGTTMMYYDGAKMDTERYWKGLNFVRTNASISDENGNLLFYTNGVKVYNSAHALMENGDTLNPSRLIFEKYPEMLYEGYRYPQAAMIIKKPQTSNLYYILHSTLEHSDNPNIQVFCKGLYYSLVDISINNGLGKVIKKNIPIIEDTLNTSLKVCRHANGIDWWMILQDVFANCFHTLLITDTGIVVNRSNQCFNSSYMADFDFSPDGKRFARMSWDRGVAVFDFDRCTGKLSNMKESPIPDLLDSGFFGTGVSFSPNSRYLYATAHVKVYQYDLEAPDIHASRVELTYWDGFHGPPDDDYFFLPTMFSTPQLAPDGKIYIGTGNTTRYFHVIHDPDKKGKACNIQQHSFRLPTGNGSVPNFPNYRLGAKSCTTSIAELARQLRIRTVYNSAMAWLWIDYGNLDWSGDPVYSIQIHNTLGQVVEHRVLPMYSAYQHIATHTWADGVYLITILRNDTPLWNGKVVKE